MPVFPPIQQRVSLTKWQTLRIKERNFAADAEAKVKIKGFTSRSVTLALAGNRSREREFAIGEEFQIVFGRIHPVTAVIAVEQILPYDRDVTIVLFIKEGCTSWNVSNLP